MRTPLARCYLKPNETAYRFFDTLNRYIWWFIASTCLIVPAYPLLHSGYYFYQHAQKQQEFEQRQRDFDEQQQRLNRLTQQQQSRQNSTQFAALNAELKQLIEQENAKIEQMQWLFGQQPKIELTLRQPSPTAFRLIQRIGSLKPLMFQEIRLMKLHEERQIQLNARLILRTEAK